MAFTAVFRLRSSYSKCGWVSTRANTANRLASWSQRCCHRGCSSIHLFDITLKFCLSLCWLQIFCPSILKYQRRSFEHKGFNEWTVSRLCPKSLAPEANNATLLLLWGHLWNNLHRYKHLFHSLEQQVGCTVCLLFHLIFLGNSILAYRSPIYLIQDYIM